jgi:predicted Ser/Thr protein kinase
VLKAYAYLARKAKDEYFSRHPLIIPPVNRSGDENQDENRGTRNNSHYSLRPNYSYGSSEQSSTSETKQRMDMLQNFKFTDFEFKSILGTGQSGKTLLCKFRSEMIALKSIDLYKRANFLNKMLKEVEIYKDLADIQGKYIPKLVCYGYYGGGLSFIMGMTIVGTTLNHHKITKQQRSIALDALKAVHDHGILHNDIREENILVNDKGDMYLIDFGMASRADLKNKRKLFNQETLELSSLLDRYTV